MPRDRHTGLKINEVGADPSGTPVLVINCRCVLPHGNTKDYQASHADGCLFKPSEGLVFDMDGGVVKGWGCRDIFGTDLTPLDADKTADIRKQMDAIIEESIKLQKKRRKKLRRERPFG